MRALAALGAAGVLALAGCSADEAGPSTLPPLASASPSASGSPSASATTADVKPPASQESPSASPSHGAAKPQVPVPSAALPATPQAASAFARHFFAEINAAYDHLEPERIRRLSTGDCGSCAAVAADIARLAAAAHRVDGQRYVLTAAEAAPMDAEERVIVDFRFVTEPYVERDRSGRVVQQFPAEKARDGQALLIRADGGWRVSAIRLVEA